MITETIGVHFEFPYRNADLVKITDYDGNSSVVPFEALVEAINSQETIITDNDICAKCSMETTTPES